LVTVSSAPPATAPRSCSHTSACPTTMPRSSTPGAGAGAGTSRRRAHALSFQFRQDHTMLNTQLNPITLMASDAFSAGDRRNTRPPSAMGARGN
jgi:hypothetical protein